MNKVNAFTTYGLALLMSIGSHSIYGQTNPGVKPTVIDVLKSQLRDGKPSDRDEYDSHNFSATDLEATIPILKKILIANGVKFLTAEEFKKKMKLFFGRTLDYSSKQNHLFVDYENPCSRDILYKKNGVVLNGTFIIKEGFVTDLYAIPEIIDYQKLLPDYREIEADKIIKKEPDLGKEIEIPRWKDYESLKTARAYRLKVLIARNKYLLNNSRKDFTWLVEHDIDFLTYLFLTYGYAEEKLLLMSVIGSPQKIVSDDDLLALSKRLWTSHCNGKVVVHPKSLEVIKEFARPDRSEHILGIAKCINVFFWDIDNPFKDMSFPNKAYVIAHLLEFGEQYKYNKAYKLGQMFTGNFIYYLDGKGIYRKEFEKNNYYGLPNLKGWLEKAEKEQDIFKNIEMADNPTPEDYLSMSKSGYTPNQIKR